MNPENVITRIRRRGATGNFVPSGPAVDEMAAENISYLEMREAMANCEMIEDYHDANRGPCCLVGGFTASGRPLHIVCTSARSTMKIITVYEPRPPFWVTPSQRGA